MTVLPWTEYKQGWIFRHRDMPVPEQDLALILPLTPQASLQYWRQHVSKEATHAEHFLHDDWAAQKNVWQQSASWQSEWDRDAPDLPELLAVHCSWDDNTVVYFCYHCENVVQTTWAIYRRHWKNFLFFDDEPILMAKKTRTSGAFSF